VVIPSFRISLDVGHTVINPLIIVRDIHFASSVIVAGTIFFDLFVAVPVLRADLRLPLTESTFGDRTTKILWVSLAVSIASAFAWLGLLSARISGKPFDEVVTDGTIWIVLWQTQFGLAWAVRILFGMMLTASLLPRRKGKTDAIWQKVMAALLAAGYLGSLAFAGHGQEGLGADRSIHLAADFLHLIAAGLWLGGLIPLAILLTFLRRLREESWVLAACGAAGRFSSLGILAVSVLLISGTINVSFLVGGIQNLTETGYGRLLVLKLVLFVTMFCLATINRQYLLPRICDEAGIDQSCLTVQKLVRSTLAETALGLGIIMIVGILGIMPPAVDMTTHVH
jgi:putative copper resistance protein D